MDIRGKKLVLIGGAGLIGSHTLDTLVKEDVKEILIYDNMSRGSFQNIETQLNDPRVKLYEIGGDILQPDILESALENADGVFHFAALWLLQCHNFPQAAFEVNIRGSFNVIEACIKKNVKKLIYSSSASVYGDANYEPMDETHPLNNKNFYGATKIAVEAILRSYHHRYDLDYIGLRYMNVYGSRQDYKGAYIAVIMKMLDSIDKGQSPKIFGTGTESFDFINVKDCGRANVCAIKSDYKDEFYNVGTGKKTSLKILAELITQITGNKKPIEYIKRDENTFVKSRIGCPKKAKKEIKFEYEIELIDGLKELIKWRSLAKKKIIYS